MRSIRFALTTICALAFAGCATNPKPVTAAAPATPKVVPPRSDCPEGYHLLTNVRGTACTPKTEAQVDVTCKPQQCGDHTVFDCYVDMVPDPENPEMVHCFMAARNEDGSLRVEWASDQYRVEDTPEVWAARVDKFYAFLREYLHGNPNPQETPAHLRYHGYYGLADQLSETPSDTLMEDGRSRALASEPWFESTVLSDIEHCDADLARTAMRVAVHFTRRGALKGIVKVQRFRDVTLPEEVRLALLHAWLNAVAGMYDDRAKAAQVHGPVLDELEKSDPSPLIRQAVPLYRNMLANSTCCGLIHWPNDRPAPVDAQGLIHFNQHPLGRIYEPEDAWPLPEPHEGGGRKGACPPSS